MTCGDNASSRERELEVLIDVGKALSSTLDLKEILQLVMQRLGNLFPVSHRALLVLDIDADDLCYEVVSGIRSDVLLHSRVRKGRSVAGWVAMHGEVVFVEDVYEDSRFDRNISRSTYERDRSVLVVPLKYKNHVVGVIEFANPDPAPFMCIVAREVLSAVASLVAAAVDGARSYSRLQHMVIVDELTGLYNASYLMDFIGNEIERAIRYKTPLSLIFIDLDFFKRVNDSHGHIVGSRTITEVGLLLKASIRKSDIAARYGGDEFVLVLPNTGKDGAKVLACNLRRVVAENDFLVEEGCFIKITASFGVASFPEDGDSKLKVLQNADKAMYLAKQSGRNRVCSVCGEVLSEPQELF
ncbi:MAG: sensor domain-containing diguanylate cyclase [Deltaproteobacteria bacterium]|nr:MAG: sensor domain-containing diguanylate cyclase [Deltaproteobacteria bacterium]